jgi:hypothetical protein
MNIVIRSANILYGVIFLVGSLEGETVQLDGLIGGLSFLARGLMPKTHLTDSWALAIWAFGAAAIFWRAWVLLYSYTSMLEISLQLSFLLFGLVLLTSQLFGGFKHEVQHGIAIGETPLRVS